MKVIPKLWAKRADQKHDNNRSRLVSAPGTNYTIVAVNLQMFGGETCIVYVKVDHAGHETTDKNNLRSTRANFK